MDKSIIPGGYGDYTPGYCSKGTMILDFDERVDMMRMRKERLEKGKKELFKERSLGSHLAIDEKNIRYLTGSYTPLWTTPASGLRYALLPKTADWPILYEQGDIGYHTKRICPWLSEVKYAITGASWIGAVMGKEGHAFQRNKMVAQIKADLEANGVSKEPMGIDVYDPYLVDAFKKEGIDVAFEGSGALLDARAIKTKDEVQCLREAAAIAESTFTALRENIKPAVSEHVLMSKMFEAAYLNGAEVYSGMFAASGKYTWPNLRAHTGRMIRPGDVVYADTYNMGWNGYRTCYYRTFSCGQPPKSVKDAYQRTYDWLYGAIKVIKPGISSKEIAEKFPKTPDVWGWYGVTSEDENAGSNWGHGIGLSLYERPIIWRSTSIGYPEKIVPGMTFAIETQDGDPNTMQGVRLEEMIVVTDTGIEMISKWPAEEITVCPI